LIGVLESAVRGSNAQFDAREILDRLDIKLNQVTSEAFFFFLLSSSPATILP
jgi:hypothetical protein